MEVENILEEDNKKIDILIEDLTLLESYVRDLFTFLPFPICFVSPLGIILEANPAFQEISHFSFSELVGESVEKLFPKEEIQKIIKETFQEKSVNKELKIFTKEKKEIPVQVFTKIRKDENNNILGLFIGVFDLTEIKKFQEDQRKTQLALLNILEDVDKEKIRAEEEKDKTLAIINNFPDGILIFNEENILTLLNPKTENFLKIKANEVIGKSFQELKEIPSFSPLLNLIGDKITGFSRKELEYSENIVFQVSSIPIIIKDIKRGYIITLHDVSREKLIERMKTEFVSISAHQLRTPLSAIKWSLKMLLDGDLGDLTKEQKEFVEKAYLSNERMIRLVNDLLNVTRIEEGRFLTNLKAENFVEIIKEMYPSFQELARKKNLAIELILKQDKFPLVLVDREKIKIVIQNLVENAIHYTPKGKITITVEIKDNNLLFSVKDTGIGIPEKQKDRIFSRFFRAENAILSETEGTGLGLFISKNIIEAHGGKIWFESKEGEGTTFYFTLPLEKEFEEFIKSLV
jgi:PAS domain S-box-containing protein